MDAPTPPWSRWTRAALRFTRKNRTGPRVSYFQQAHDYRDPKTGQARVMVLYNLGREKNLDLAESQRGGAHDIAGEKMRSGRKDVEQALSRAGRFETVGDDLLVKGVVADDGERRKRYIVVRNPPEAGTRPGRAAAGAPATGSGIRFPPPGR